MIRRFFAVVALCAGLGAILAAPASADVQTESAEKEIFMPPYALPS
ncbi:hypothetical protein ACQPZF_06825 [Actinosynnema sp. CS-041913]